MADPIFIERSELAGIALAQANSLTPAGGMHMHGSTATGSGETQIQQQVRLAQEAKAREHAQQATAAQAQAMAAIQAQAQARAAGLALNAAAVPFVPQQGAGALPKCIMDALGQKPFVYFITPYVDSALVHAATLLGLTHAIPKNYGVLDTGATEVCGGSHAVNNVMDISTEVYGPGAVTYTHSKYAFDTPGGDTESQAAYCTKGRFGNMEWSFIMHQLPNPNTPVLIPIDNFKLLMQIDVHQSKGEGMHWSSRKCGIPLQKALFAGRLWIMPLVELVGDFNYSTMVPITLDEQIAAAKAVNQLSKV